jgi:hypothetical protein
MFILLCFTCSIFGGFETIYNLQKNDTTKDVVKHAIEDLRAELLKLGLIKLIDRLDDTQYLYTLNESHDILHKAKAGTSFFIHIDAV